MISEKILSHYSQVFVVGAMHTQAPTILKLRRQAHIAKLTEPMVFFGLDREPGAENVWMMNGLRIFQEPAVLYLTGINQTHIRLILNPLAPKNQQEILFVPTKNPEKEFWDGVRIGLPAPVFAQNKNSESATPTETSLAEVLNLAEIEQARQDIMNLTGVDRVERSEDFYTVASEIFSEANLGKTAKFFFHEWLALNEKTQEPELKCINNDHNFEKYTEFKSHFPHLAITSGADLHYDLRLCQDEFQQADAQIAQEITAKAFAKWLPKLRAQKFKTENEAARALEYYMLRKTPHGLAFPTISASGKNACTLHYLKNDAPLKKGQLILMDFGAKWGTQHADISRTVPINGIFNPLQAILYDIVLEAMDINQNFLAPGKTLREANLKVWNFIEKALQERFFDLGGVAERVYIKNDLPEGAVQRPHGVSHLMGEQEHDGDPFRIYADTPLRPGMMLSNEPGIYGHFKIEINGLEYDEYIGIRIEDDLIITQKGCDNLSWRIPKTRTQLEHQMTQGD